MKVDRMPTMVQTHGDKKEEIGSNIFKKQGLKCAFIHAISVTAGFLFVSIITIFKHQGCHSEQNYCFHGAYILV